jgi:hypothetical protein
MSKTQIFWVSVIVIILIAIGIHLDNNNSNAKNTIDTAPTKTQLTALNDCLDLCQAAFDDPTTGSANSQKEDSCNNTCYSAANLSPTSTPSTQ